MRRRDEKHLKWLRTTYCCICLDNTSIEACHVRLSDSSIGKFNPGMKEKPDDCFTLPLCSKHHREQHRGSELMFWKRYDIDPVKLSLRIHSFSGDTEALDRLIKGRRSNILAAG